MTTIENLTYEQITALSSAAAQAGDLEMVSDCDEVERCYLASDQSTVADAIDCDRGDARDCARRIVDAIVDGEGQGDCDRRAT
jgi:hypothetical protein